MTLTDFCSKSHIDAALVRAVVKQSGGWSEFDQTARDVCTGGADGGFHGFIYYTDTVKFAKAHKAELIQLAKDMADDMGEKSAYALIAGFNCLKMEPDAVAEAIHNPRSEDATNVYNALSWFALEEVARSYCDMTETA